MIPIPAFKTKTELFSWLKTNKNLLITERKSALKFSDPVVFGLFTVNSKGSIEKAEANPELLNLSEFNAKVAINTTNIMDSCSDVHFPGLWTKSLQEGKIIYHLQEHKMQFDHIISDRVQASTKMMSWKELGYNFEGMTEVLVFDSAIEKARNPYMFDQYANGYVKNHSVGMRYIKVELAMNSESKFDAEEKKTWDKYISQVVNRSVVDEQGYFFAVTEAKVIEGSAVPMGANYATPTISIGEKTLSEAVADTSPEPSPLFGLKFLNHKN